MEKDSLAKLPDIKYFIRLNAPIRSVRWIASVPIMLLYLAIDALSLKTLSTIVYYAVLVLLAAMFVFAILARFEVNKKRFIMLNVCWLAVCIVALMFLPIIRTMMQALFFAPELLF